MIINNVITLDDNTKYLLLDDTVLENIKYFYAVEVDNVSLEPLEHFVFLKESLDSKNICATIIDDVELCSALLIIFTNNLGLEMDKYSQNN
ncbi:MAG: hypothetical protein RSB72_02745 [Bacilli bacterium]